MGEYYEYALKRSTLILNHVNLMLIVVFQPESI